jgi:Nif-specific regulatory protein
VLLSKGDSIEINHLPPSLQMPKREGQKRKQDKLIALIEGQERAIIVEALKETKGNQSQAAKILGTTKRIVQYKIQKLGIDPGRFRQKRNDRPLN